jgi:FtsZ-binding cell division protein ZapB
METKTNNMFSVNMADLPVMKHLDSSSISTKVDSFRKGEMSLFTVIKLALLGGVCYLTWVHVLPPVFQAIGQMMAVAATGVMIVLGILVAPVVVKALRLFTRWLHKLVIKHDPFAQLEIEKGKMLDNQRTFRTAKQNILTLKQEMEVEAKKAEEDATGGQTKILALRGKAENVKAEMDEMFKKMGVEAKGEDDYVNKAASLQKILAESQRVVNRTKQSKDFVQKYGSRANVMKKLNQKLILVETAMEIKINDFDATVEFLKKDYAFASKANTATSAAYKALGFGKDWKYDYTLEVITSAIANDIAMTSGNLKDIDSITSNYTLDSDELYANLNMVADQISTGSIEGMIPDASAYSNPEYTLTSDDKVKSGGFGDMFE